MPALRNFLVGKQLDSNDTICLPSFITILKFDVDEKWKKLKNQTSKK